MDYKISASILNANFLNLEKDIDNVLNLIDEIHLDIMDGQYVDNISFGPPVIASLRQKYDRAVFDTHLMISDPVKYYKDFLDAGSDILVFHYEATQQGYIILRKVRDADKKVGVALNPATDVLLLEPIKELVDRVLIMTVEPGFGGQQIIPEMFKKIERARKMFGDHVEIQVDGGINDNTIMDVKNAGANNFVVGSYIFGAPNKTAMIERLRSQLH